jgi:threonyl-tRNA synthetase
MQQRLKAVRRGLGDYLVPTITLPDGSQRSFPQAVSVADIASSIGAGLARAALAGRVNGKVVDTSHVVDEDAAISIVTAKDADGLEVIRHSTAHLLAQAVKALFPTAQVTIGPVIEDGFYYDFAYERPFTPDDLAAIEKKMAELAAQEQPVRRQVMPRARPSSTSRASANTTRPKSSSRSRARGNFAVSQGDFTDLCRGPHVPDTGKLQAFKLMKIAGAYWRGDSRNEMLQRIYGTAWADKKALAAYCTAWKKRRSATIASIGRQLDLFHFQEEAPGMVFWHPKGWVIWQQIEQYMRGVLTRHGYAEVRTRRSSTPACGRSPGIGTNSTRTCSRPSRRPANTRSSR